MPAVMTQPVPTPLAHARSITDRLFGQVRPEAFFDRPIPERHRILFYIGHVEAFDWNLIGKTALGMTPVNEELDQLFAFGIDPPPGHLPQDKISDWPTIEQTLEYVMQVRKRLDKVMKEAPEEELQMAVEHRLMHAETFTYILHNLPYECRIVGRTVSASSSSSPALQMIEVPAGTVTMGRKRGAGFGWDNEYEFHTKEVPALTISKYKITNGQYLDFVKAGGPRPLYWIERRGQWFYRGMQAELPLPMDWPVYVSYSQAKACASWMGKSLPTEGQFHRAAFGTPQGPERAYPWGDIAPFAQHGNFSFYERDLVSVTANPAGDSAFGISQLVGNGWEWTATVFEPFAGFQVSATYPGYSANFFDGDHYVLKGGSCATDTRLLRSSFRNWFREHYPYAYTTFRVVEN